MNEHYIRKYFFSALLLISAVSTVIVLWPFFTTIALGIMLAVLFHPMYEWFQKHVRISSLSSFLTLVCFIILLVVPLFFIILVVLRQSQSLYASMLQHNTLNVFIAKFNASVHHVFPTVSFNLNERLPAFFTSIGGNLESVFTATFSTLITFILVLLTMFYFLKDGPQWKLTLMELSPLSAKSNEHIIERLSRTIGGIVKSYLFVGLLQAVCMTTGLFIFGVPHAVLWGVFAGFASLLPTVGTALVSVPSIIFLWSTGQTGSAIGLMVWWLSTIAIIDTFFNPWLVGKRIDIHPLLVLFAVLGAVAIMGPIGLLMGPLIISFLYALVSIYKDETVI